MLEKHKIHQQNDWAIVSEFSIFNIDLLLRNFQQSLNQLNTLFTGTSFHLSRKTRCTCDCNYETAQWMEQKIEVVLTAQLNGKKINRQVDVFTKIYICMTECNPLLFFRKPPTRYHQSTLSSTLTAYNLFFSFRIIPNIGSTYQRYLEICYCFETKL